MTLLEILNIANAAYPDGHLAAYYDPQTGEPVIPKAEVGDTLAMFIVRELRSVYNPAARADDKLYEAQLAMTQAATTLVDLAEAIQADSRYEG